MGLAETKEAIEAASTAFKTWSKITAKVRTFYIPSDIIPILNIMDTLRNDTISS